MTLFYGQHNGLIFITGKLCIKRKISSIANQKITTINNNNSGFDQVSDNMGYNAIPTTKKQVKNKLLKNHQIFKPYFPHTNERKKAFNSKFINV
jgi:hypothetical protein